MMKQDFYMAMTTDFNPIEHPGGGICNNSRATWIPKLASDMGRCMMKEKE